VYLHAGFLHILGNMLFLWVFGDNVEDRLGHLGYLLFYSAAGVVASLAQGVIDTDSVVPNVGASGAVAGVLGAYIVYFPKATVTTLIPIAIILIPFPIPAWIMIGIWFLQNLLSGFATLATVDAGDGGIAFFAHIGGFVFGAVVVLLFLRGAGKRAPPLPHW
jgi:membrane associated rhomboid family serine protease